MSKRKASPLTEMLIVCNTTFPRYLKGGGGGEGGRELIAYTVHGKYCMKMFSRNVAACKQIHAD